MILEWVCRLFGFSSWLSFLGKSAIQQNFYGLQKSSSSLTRSSVSLKPSSTVKEEKALRRLVPFGPNLSSEIRIYKDSGEKVHENDWWFHCDGTIVVFDITDENSYESVDRWMADIRTYAWERPTLLLGNKSDLSKQRQISREEAQEYADANSLLYYEVSATTGQGIEYAILKLAVEALIRVRNDLDDYRTDTLLGLNLNKKILFCQTILGGKWSHAVFLCWLLNNERKSNLDCLNAVQATIMRCYLLTYIDHDDLMKPEQGIKQFLDDDF